MLSPSVPEVLSSTDSIAGLGLYYCYKMSPHQPWLSGLVACPAIPPPPPPPGRVFMSELGWGEMKALPSKNATNSHYYSKLSFLSVNAFQIPQALKWLSTLCFFLLLLLLFRAALKAYGRSQARCWIRAAAAGLHHSTATRDLSHIWDLHHRSQQCQILNPLSEAMDWTCMLMDTSQVCYCWATTWTPFFFFFLPMSLLSSLKSLFEGKIFWPPH